MINYILDTNILIYLSKNDQKYIEFLETIKAYNLGISIITYLEILVGTEKEGIDEKDMFESLQNYEVLDINKKISNEVVKYLKLREKRSLKDPRFTDIVIACTAVINSVPLITNNPKDFNMFTDLEILVP